MKRKNNKGFTLIELLAVIVILGIILTVVVSNILIIRELVLILIHTKLFLRVQLIYRKMKFRTA